MKNYTITVNGNVYDVVVEEGTSTGVAPVATAPKAAPKAAPKTAAPKAAAGAGSVKVEAGAAGKIFKIEANVGQAVKKGDTVVILEAMKMEIPVVAPQDGTVASIDVAVVEEEENLADDMELVAVIAAAIAAYEGTSTDGFQVRSIKRASTKKWQRA